MENDFIKLALKRVKKKKEIAELDIESEFVKYAKSLGCKPIKLIVLNMRGWPDRSVFCPNGKVIFIEFKKKNKYLSPTQKPWKRTLEDLGFDYLICDEKGQAENYLDLFLSGDLL